jgi:hypothetical protein
MLVIKKERQGKNIERKLLLKSVTVISSETPMEMWVSMSVSAKTATSPSLGDDSILKAMNANCPQPVYMDRQRNMAMLSLAILVARLSLYSRWSRTVKPPSTTAKRKKKQNRHRGEGYPQDMTVFSKLCFNDYQFSFMDTKHWFPFSF